ncbi:hypothetical protein NMD12_06510 [Citrobacter portucalensis]|uniref:hypothetical protein n=1 Tax=Citrobacter portucalensis TaxID=1639133 RepID=UPI00351CEE7E
MKRYSVGYKDSASGRYAAMLDKPDGGYVSHEDYAALEARCAALAAENAGMKALARGWANATDDRLFEEHGEIFHDSIDACEEELKTICPTTDTFLAEVRAQGVEQLASLAGNECQRYKSVNDRAGARKWKSIVILCADFAAQLRKGVQS